MLRFHGWRNGPSPGFLLVLASRLSTRVKPFAGWPGTSLHQCRALHSPTFGHFLVLPSRCSTTTWPTIGLTSKRLPSPSLNLKLGGLPFQPMTSQLSPLCKWRTAPRSFSPFLIYLSFSPRVLRRPTDSLAPRNMFLCCGLLCSSVFSLCSFPSISPLVSPLIRDGRYCGGRRCSKVPVSCSFSGSLLDSPFRSLTVPLLGSVPSRCRCFTLSYGP